MAPDALRPRQVAGNFVGREPELDEGLGVLDDVLRGRGRVLLISGESGIGKSRIADELATSAKAKGFHVAWGRCWEAGGAPAYWPWAQSLRTIAGQLGNETVRASLGPSAGDMAQLLRDVDTGEPTASSESLDPDEARFRLFDATATFLRKAAATVPLMLVIDDLQAADMPSLVLLRFVAGALTDERILVVGTYREAEVAAGPALAATFADLAREPSVRRLTLLGLGKDDVQRFIEAAAGFAPPAELVDTVHDQTEGNPLFVQEVTRLLIEEGRLKRDSSALGAGGDASQRARRDRTPPAAPVRVEPEHARARLGARTRVRPGGAGAARRAARGTSGP